ncbi:hypothetical protein SARC_05489 [Sphaeroforma arctica JP610]|uniref:Lysophospholipid acyltransferase 5 n=1 Tax=Sphaeroforma arctica JP610 TaxID=667725 RepID=A0A0L0FZG3_9EUKA|nr:hypothetical protein SARC_05489 [Sphaeroforma arctica JP610]KNC82222.1 hypothetical protein SARC_05489 [Sphaeroforma arctica JP610]|eukprot:XP_014156124.1 hypothetical protein SARC_05489 [Sphaeroforma arctica JP610]
MNYPLEFHYITFSITVTWLCLKLLGPNVAMCTVNSVFNMGFLLYAYRCYETDDYDINWTTAQCVMCLRNISLGFDYMDGETLKQKGAEKLSPDQVVNSIDTPPSYLEMLGFSLFFPCVLVGPQVTYRHFRSYLDTYIPGHGGRPTRREHLIPALYSFAEGIMYFVGSQVLSYPAEHFFSQEYQHEWNLWERYQFFFLHSITFFWRYFGCWKLAESACQLTGAAYLGRNENGKIHWGLHNFHSWRFFSGINLDEIIKTFNINTNYWVMRIVFKRLRWLGNKNASQLGALFFLAIWHGFHTSYFLAFGMEFYELFAERGIRKWASGLIEYVDQSPAPIRFSGMLFAWVSRCTLLGNGVILFEMLDVMKGLEVHKSLYFLPTILPTIYLIIPMVLPPPNAEEENFSRNHR